ncbi:MAG: iron transporter [Desulfobacterales bacterium]
MPQKMTPASRRTAAGEAPESTMRSILSSGIRKGWSGALWMYRILIPISFFTLILEMTHVIERLDGVLAPIMGLIHLPAKAALPLVAGLLTGIYGGIASMAVLDLTIRESTLIAVFLLISHNMIQESVIQGQSGVNPIKAAAARLATSVAVVWLMGFFWGEGARSAVAHAAAAAPAGTAEMLMKWGLQTLKLCLQILVILIGIMVLMEWMRATRLSDRLAGMLSPLLRLLGLSERTGMLWLTAVLFGVSYGGAVIVEEVRHGSLASEELERLHLSIGINHSMIEDPALFLPLGISAVWLWVPRLLAAVIAVQLLIVWRLVRRRSPASAGVKG